MSLQTILVIMQKEIRDARRNKWFVTISLLFTILSISLSLLGVAGLGTFGVSGFGRTAASLLNLVLFIVPIMGLLLGAMSIVGEREQGTLLTLLAQPVTTHEIFIGKLMGSSCAMIATICLGFGASGLVIARYAGVDQISNYLILTFFTLLLGIIFLSIGFCISVFTKRHGAAIGFALFTWFFFIFLSDLGLMGTSMVLKLSAHQFFWLILFNPAQCFKLAVIGNLQKSLETFGAVGMYASEIFGQWLGLILMVVMMVWMVVSLVTAMACFKTRCVD